MRSVGSEGRVGALQVRHVVEEIVDRLQGAGVGVLQQSVEPSFGLARKQRNPHVERLDETLRRLTREHRETAGDVEAADADGDAGFAQRARDVERARKLV